MGNLLDDIGTIDLQFWKNLDATQGQFNELLLLYIFYTVF